MLRTNLILLFFPLQSAVEEEEDEEKPAATTAEKEPEKPADLPEQINPENNLPSTEVKRSAGLFIVAPQIYRLVLLVVLGMRCLRACRCDFLFNVDLTYLTTWRQQKKV